MHKVAALIMLHFMHSLLFFYYWCPLKNGVDSYYIVNQ